MMKAGMNVARLNFSHGTHEEYEEVIPRIRKISKDLDWPVAILQDLQGPRIRVGKLREGINLMDDSEVSLICGVKEQKDEKIPVSYADLYKDVHSGDMILIKDGELELEVLSSAGGEIKCRVKQGGLLESNKGINVPAANLKIDTIKRMFFVKK